MNRKTKIYLLLSIPIFLVSFVFLFHSQIVHACTSTNQNYCLLAPLPGLGSEVKTDTGVGNYLNTLIRVIIGFMAVLAVVMMVVGGIQYMVSNIAGEKASAKSRMTNAIFGLVLALSSYMILNTINPNLVNLKIGITSTSITMFDDFFDTDPGEDGIATQSDQTDTSSGSQVKDITTGDIVTACNSSRITPVYINTSDVTAALGGKLIPTKNGANSVALLDSVQTSFHSVWYQYATSPGYNPNYTISITNPDGGYNCRRMKKKDGTDGKYSAHSFGLAVDVNSTTNLRFFGKDAKVVTDLPPALITAFKNNGWGWGGDWVSQKDTMHFSKLDKEQGKGADSYTQMQ